jgi:hypothetical protein
LYENFETDILSLPSEVWTSLMQEASHVSGNPGRFHLNNVQDKADMRCGCFAVLVSRNVLGGSFFCSFLGLQPRVSEDTVLPSTFGSL